jgi:hypothetical protein
MKTRTPGESHENLNPIYGSISINNDCAIVLRATVATAANGND